MPGGGVSGLVAGPVFKTGVSSDPAQAGSIPVRLRDQGFRLLASVRRWRDPCLLERVLARFYPLRPFQRGKQGDPKARRLLVRVARGVKEISPTTLEGYRRQIDQRINPALGRIPVRRLDVETLDGFYAELRRRGKAGGEPLSASTVRAST